MKKKYKMIARVKYLTKKFDHKYGLEVPRNATHAYELDKRNKNMLWVNAIKREMTNVKVDFDVKKK